MPIAKRQLFGVAILVCAVQLRAEELSADDKSTATETRLSQSGDEVLRAFPSAEGFGAATTGGRAGRVVQVTNLNRRGPGSFAWALNEVKEPRTIVFAVSGVIDCRDEISFTINAENDHVTIAGETSPGGVAIYNYRNFVIRDGAEQVIMRFLRFRGTRIHLRNDPDGLLIWHAKNVIVDHCSFAGACDETISASDVDNVTIQWTGFDESRKEKLIAISSTTMVSGTIMAGCIRALAALPFTIACSRITANAIRSWRKNRMSRRRTM